MEAFDGSTRFGQGNVSILVSSFQCEGTESALAVCSHMNTSVDCGHQQDAGVICSSCQNGDVRLVNGNQFSGQVEVCGNQKWITVCNDTWDREDASVLCKQLGHSEFGEQCMQYSHGQFCSGQCPIGYNGPGSEATTYCYNALFILYALVSYRT